MAYDDSAGSLRIARVDTVDAEKFRCDVSFLGSYSNAKSVPFNPSPLIGFCPTAGSMVLVSDRPGIGKRILFPLHDPGTLTNEEKLVREDKKGTVPNMKEGEVYIGHRGRAYFNSNGDALISSQGRRAAFDLLFDKGRAEVYGQNFDIYTPGKNVRVHSTSTVSAGPLQTWGDSLSMEVNIPVAPTVGSAPEVLPTTLGQFSITKIGTVDATVHPLLVNQLNLHLDSSTGAIELGRGFPLKTIGLTIGVLEDLSVFNTKSNMRLGNLGDVSINSLPGLASMDMLVDGSIEISNPFGFIGIDPAGNIQLSNSNGILSLESSGAFSVTTPSYGLGFSAAGDLLFTGKSVDISGTTTARIAGVSTASIEAAIINLGLIPAGHPAFAEALVLILQQLNAYNLIVKTHTHSILGVVTSGLGSGGSVVGGVSGMLDGTGGAAPSAVLLAATVPPVPTASAIGSTTVSVQA